MPYMLVNFLLNLFQEQLDAVKKMNSELESKLKIIKDKETKIENGLKNALVEVEEKKREIDR